jgi:hypothetical protein
MKGIDSRLSLSKDQLLQQIESVLVSFEQEVVRDSTNNVKKLTEKVQTIQDLAKQCLDLIAQLEKEYYVRGGKYATFTNIILHKIGLSEVHDTKEAFIQSIEKTSYQHSLKKMKVIAKLIKQQNAFWLRRTFIFSLKYTVSLFDKFRKKTLSWIKRQCCL